MGVRVRVNLTQHILFLIFRYIYFISNIFLFNQICTRILVVIRMWAKQWMEKKE